MKRKDVEKFCKEGKQTQASTKKSKVYEIN